MPDVLDAFSLLGELSEDSLFAERLRIKADEVLVAPGDDIERKLADIYVEAERELARRSRTRIRPEDIRRQVAQKLAGLGEDHLGFRMLFMADAPQLIAAASVLMRAYAESCRVFFGPNIVSGIVGRGLDGTPWNRMEISIEAGISYTPQRMRSLGECGEIIMALFSAWHARMRSLIGAAASARLFEMSYREVEKSHGFLPMIKTLLSMTPSGVLLEEKAKRLQELETETMTQALNIRTADQDLGRQAAQLRSAVMELEDTKRKLEIVGQARSEFIDVVAHQFRTPLSAIRWNGELLADAVEEKKIDGQFAESVETVRVKSLFLIETLERVFATLDIETGKLVIDPKPAFLWEAVQDAHNQYVKEIARRGLKWKFQREKEQLKEIPMDTAKISTVLKILISNAINYSSDGGSIAVSVVGRNINGNEYHVFTIKDTGIGIPKEEVEKIFEKFYRAQPAKLKSPDGTGLGMFIVKSLVEAHRGMVKLESEGVGKGTTISIALPVK